MFSNAYSVLGGIFEGTGKANLAPYIACTVYLLHNVVSIQRRKSRLSPPADGAFL